MVDIKQDRGDMKKRPKDIEEYFRLFDDDSTLDSILKMTENLDYSCFKCWHLYKNGFSCKAFPEVIPASILAGQRRHTKPMLGQKNKITFEKSLNSEPSEDKKKEVE